MEKLIWPTVVVLIAIAILLILKTPISEFIGRIQKIDKTGIKATSQDSRVNESSNTDSKSRSFSDFMDIGISPVTKRYEKSIRASLESIETNSSEEIVSMLVRSLAQQQLKTTYNNFSNIIYGSQLEILSHVNSQAKGVNESQIREYFDKAKKDFPEFHAPTTYESYVGFLLKSGLLIRRDEKIEISDLGIGFLKYLVDSGLTYKRRG